MNLKAICKPPCLSGCLRTKTLLVMKFFAFFMLVACLHANANGYAQKISVSGKNSSIKDVFRSIEKQTDYQFFYNERLLRQAGKINIELRDASVEQVLEACFRDLPLSYAIVQNTIIIKSRALNNLEAQNPPALTVRGRITSAGDIPVANASVMI